MWFVALGFQVEVLVFDFIAWLAVIKVVLFGLLRAEDTSFIRCIRYFARCQHFGITYKIEIVFELLICFVRWYYFRSGRPSVLDSEELIFQERRVLQSSVGGKDFLNWIKAFQHCISILGAFKTHWNFRLLVLLQEAEHAANRQRALLLRNIFRLDQLVP